MLGFRLGDWLARLMTLDEFLPVPNLARSRGVLPVNFDLALGFLTLPAFC
jgi:hypothetical protein